jgi:hypothetical protein
MQHMGMLKRVLQYLAGTRNYAINYRRSYTPIAPLIGYTVTTQVISIGDIGPYWALGRQVREVLY